jgi:hypothetical protein
VDIGQVAVEKGRVTGGVAERGAVDAAQYAVGGATMATFEPSDGRQVAVDAEVSAPTLGLAPARRPCA